MPSIKNKETIDLIARAYIANGFNKEQALLDAGYSLQYARGGRSAKVYSNVLVKQAISALQAPKEQEFIVKKAEILQNLHKLAFPEQYPGTTVSNIDRIRATELLGKYLSLWTDNISTKTQNLNINVSHDAEMPDKPPGVPVSGRSPVKGKIVAPQNQKPHIENGEAGGE